MTQVVLDGEVYPSKVEAAWAVYLAKLGVAAAHEPCAIGGSGHWYIPDFILPNERIVLEVKLSVFKESDISKWRSALSDLDRALTLVVVNGHPPGGWYISFIDPVEVPFNKKALTPLWQHGYLPRVTHDTSLARLASHEVSVGRRAEDSEVRQRRERLTTLPLWRDWLANSN